MLDETVEKKTSGFVKEIASYFRDFLESDFKKRRVPKRSIKYKNEKNFLVGLAIKKYPAFNRKLWKIINKSFELDSKLVIQKNEYKANISIPLQNLINQQADFVDDEIISTILKNIANILLTQASTNHNNPEEANSKTLDETYALIQTNLVVPFVDRIKEPIEKASQSEASSIESMFEIEERLTEIFYEPLKESLSETLNSLILKEQTKIKDTKKESLEQSNQEEENVEEQIVINELKHLLDVKFVQDSIKGYFSDFAISDLYYELINLVDSKHMLDKQDFYLYFGDIRFEKINFPIFYIPIQINKTGESFEINFDTVFYINKKALDFINQEYNKLHNRIGSLRTVSERIIYISEAKGDITPLVSNIIQEIKDKFQIQGNIDFTNPDIQSHTGLSISISNSCYVCIFDKSDESIVNDYEDMMQVIDDGSSILSDSFNKLIEDFIKKEPETITSNIEKEWYEDTTSSQKLVYASPIPLNAEQRQILNALQRKNCKYVVVEGPPGTGKSHTITAIAFEAIRNSQSVLVLSDKKEALDVAENKIIETMDNVRLSKDFQNPILRLGKSGNTYTQILSDSSIQQIKEHSRAVESTKKDMDQSIQDVETELKNYINDTIKTNKEISIDDITEMSSHEDLIQEGKYYFIVLEEFNEKKDINKLKTISTTLHYLKNLDTTVKSRTTNLFNDIFKKQTIEDFVNFLILVQIVLEIKSKFGSGIEDIKILKSFNIQKLETLQSYIKNYQDIRSQLFGFGLFFAKKQVVNLDRQVRKEFNILDFTEVHKKFDTLKKIETIYSKIKELVDYHQLNKEVKNYEGDSFVDCLEIIKNIKLLDNFDVEKIKDSALTVKDFINIYPKTSVEAGIKLNKYKSLEENKFTSISEEDFNSAVNYLTLNDNLKNLFNAVPDFSFLDLKEQLEKLVTTKTTHVMDKQVVEFAENSPAAAKTIKTIIKKKERFPREEFEKLKKAFPCIIAGIRDYADYIPLQPDLIDLVIIDEASQVSIAQAFPAILRAKKILVMGDKKQFSNVKTNQAKRITNNEYINNIRKIFESNFGTKGAELQRLTKFDIRTSILDFFEFIHNFRTMLLKHFRGYPELISYSSKFFYNNSLQAVKIRSKPIDEVLKFEIIEHDEKIDLQEIENSNKLESNFIINELKKIKESEQKITVGIITPFTNQQKFISSEISKLPEAEYFYENLKLKVMTFDGSQGEERDYVFYSMVATPVIDKLNTIFIKSLENKDLEEDSSMRVARLNVGFSRAKECMHFVLSKPVAEFNDEIGRAIKHYYNKLQDIKKGPDVSDVDPNSPMEAKVLQWIRETNFYVTNSDNIELQAQFKVGDYLKQIDKYYQHPHYKTDFLLTYKDKEDSYHKIIIEYDGFEHHFRNKGEVNEFNYEHYYNDDDVYREKVLENYGYIFLRINRFNLGTNPIETLSQRLTQLTQKKSLKK